jgi:dihydropteroate synthase
MQAALAAGASMINDVSALSHDPQSLAVAASSGAAVVLMHMQGEPGTMQRAPAYVDPALDIHEYLSARITACLAAGVRRDRIVVDPGIGFGKTIGHNLALLDQVAVFHGLGVPLMVGVSRKRFIATLSQDEPPRARLGGSLAGALAAIGQGVQIVRVHDVADTAQAIHVAAALRRVSDVFPENGDSC